MSRLTVKRVGVRDRFTQVPNWIVRPDGDLSAKAVGVLVHLLSHKDGWQTSINRLSGAFADGQHAIASAIRELEQTGHLYRVQRNTASGAVHEWFVYEDPQENPNVGKPRSGVSAARKKTKSKKTNDYKNTSRVGDESPTMRWVDAPDADRKDFTDRVANHGFEDPEETWDLILEAERDENREVRNVAAWARSLDRRGHLEGFLRGLRAGDEQHESISVGVRRASTGGMAVGGGQPS